MDLAPAWMVAVVLGREFAITVLRSLAHSRGVAIPASPLGKFKMASQVTAILLLILGWERMPVLLFLGQGAMWVVLISALWSAIDYYHGFQRAMISRDEKVADFEAAKTAREKKIS
jgi:CDP-diacylglycerol--glycerol-3-phosphate 3-phosphatidyltransferase